MRWYDKCLSSLRGSSLPTEIIVIDNASSDGTVAFIREHYPEVDLMESPKNLGFAKANNIGIRKAYDAGADYIMLLNQDAWVEPNTMAELVRCFEENEHTGIASPVHLNGTYTGLDFKFHNSMSGIFISDLYMQHIKPYYESHFINAAAWMMSRQCIATVGGFDTLLFRHYGEDVNYGQRLHYHYLRFVISTRCTICHDREDRKNHDFKYDSIASQTDRMAQRVELGDINREPNIPCRIQMLRRKIIKRILRGNFKSIPVINDEIHFLETIAKSRDTNKKTGLTWL